MNAEEAMSEAQARFLANPDVMAQVAASQAAHKADPSAGIRSGIPKRRGTPDEKHEGPARGGA